MDFENFPVNSHKSREFTQRRVRTRLRPPPLTSRDLDLWAYANDVILDFSRPGKPTDNAYIESFNGSFRAECLNAHWFMSLDDARSKLEAWRRDYNEVRPHSSIGNKPPMALIISSGTQNPP